MYTKISKRPLTNRFCPELQLLKYLVIHSLIYFPLLQNKFDIVAPYLQFGSVNSLCKHKIIHIVNDDWQKLLILKVDFHNLFYMYFNTI